MNIVYYFFIFLGTALLIFILIMIVCALTIPRAIIINHRHGGRLGDQLVCYSKAKWLAYKYNIPFYLKPFELSDQLELSKEKKYTDLSFYFYRIFYKLFGYRVWLTSEDELEQCLKTLNRPACFVCHLCLPLQGQIQYQEKTTQKGTPWAYSLLYEFTQQHPDFAKELKHMLQPIIPVKKLQLPTDRTTVAVHIRTGGGYDSPLQAQQYYDNKKYDTKYEYARIDNMQRSITTCTYTPTFVFSKSADSRNPDKFPPEQYYVDQLKKLSELLNDSPLYAYIFTDDQNQVQLMQRIKEHVNKPNILFDCRKEKNTYDTNILDDLFAMAQFDCLIRCGSGFSYAAQIVGNHKIILFPLHLTWYNAKKLIVDTVGISRVSL